MPGVLRRPRNALRAHVARIAATSLALWLACTASAYAQESCAPAVAHVVSVQGAIELRRGGAAWVAVKLNTALCTGDTLRVHPRSRAALLLSNETTLRLDQSTTLTLAPPDAGKVTTLQQMSGSVHVITRTPRAFNVKTPFINANVEGTEFLVQVLRKLPPVDDNECPRSLGTEPEVAEVDRVTVFEGTVNVRRVESQDGATLTRGQTAESSSANPSIRLVARPKDAVAWTLYVPTILPASTPSSTAVRCAARLLSIGRLDEAERLLATAREDVGAGEMNRSNAYALSAVMAVAENDKQAAEFADEAIRLNPSAAAPWIARSYVQQAKFQISDALASAVVAVKAEGSNWIAHARLAELYMAEGDLEAAAKAARDAESAAGDVRIARTRTLSGFARLRVDAAGARQAFIEAIEIDQADPLPRLGLGLAKIRSGDLAGGREEIETAVALDPEQSLLRSYLGKAYFEEKRNGFAAPQLRIAQELDPNDPTPWFYDAIRKQTENRPVEALLDLNRSASLNDNRAVYRSRLLLDDDRAARTAGVAAIHAELGFERLAILESAKALLDNADNDAAHRQLAFAYANVPRHDIARVSESLQAQLRQPLTVSPVDPRISTDNLVILKDTGPTRVGTNEFNALFGRNQNRLQIDAIGGSRGTWGDQVIVSGLENRLAYAVSQLHYETDGFGDLASTRKNAYDLFAQLDVTARTSMQLDIRRSDFELGVTYNDFDPAQAFPVRIKDRVETARLGGHTNDAGSSWIWSVFKSRGFRSVASPVFGFVLTDTDTDADAAELQYTRKLGDVDLVAGVGHINQRDIFEIQQGSIHTRATTAYLYANWRSPRMPVKLQLGLSHDRFRSVNSVFGEFTRNRTHPKLGVLWSPTSRTSVRAAAFSSLKRPLVESQTLEPTQVLGFNQFFTGFDALYGDPDGELSRSKALALDHRFSDTSFAGAEAATRDMKLPNFNVGEVDWKERTAHLYAYRMWNASASHWQMAATADFEYERITRPHLNPGAEGIVDVRTFRLPLGIRFFGAEAGSIAVTTSLVRQSGTFSVDLNSPLIDRADRAWITDLTLSRPLPNRAGIVTVGARNLFDRPIQLFETDPVNPRTAKRRLLFAKLRLVL